MAIRATVDDLWFRQMLLADPETMSYNRAWGGTIQFTKDKWKDWFDRWVADPRGERFYRDITLDNSCVFIGEAAWHGYLKMIREDHER